MSYTAADITELDDVQHTRLRPAVNLGLDVLNTALREMVDNAIEEVAEPSHGGSTVTITLHADGSVSVADDGRGREGIRRRHDHVAGFGGAVGMELELQVATGEVRPNRLMAMNPGIAEQEIDGIPAIEPAFAAPAAYDGTQHETERDQRGKAKGEIGREPDAGNDIADLGEELRAVERHLGDARGHAA